MTPSRRTSILSKRRVSTTATTKCHTVSSDGDTQGLDEIVRFIQEQLIGEESENLVSMYQGLEMPPISLEAYVHRMCENINLWRDRSTNDDKDEHPPVGIEKLMMALVFLSRLGFKITPRSIHRYLMVAVLVAVKTSEDMPISNKFWASVGGCQLQDLNMMELDFCKQLNWSLFVRQDEVEHLQAQMLNEQ